MFYFILNIPYTLPKRKKTQNQIHNVFKNSYYFFASEPRKFDALGFQALEGTLQSLPSDFHSSLRRIVTPTKYMLALNTGAMGPNWTQKKHVNPAINSKLEIGQ